MRFLLKVNIPVESGNAAAKAGKLGATIQRILSELNPEAVYFTRPAHRVHFSGDARRFSDPRHCRAGFLAFNAGIEIHPVMIPEDLARAAGAIEEAVKKYG
jgi:hypothetical protein